MILVIGAKGAGKDEYVSRNYPGKNVLYSLHLLIKEKMSEGADLDEFLSEIKRDYAGGVIICDEIGSGIVSTDRFENEWRENTGRALADLAKESDEVIRIVCGIGQKIK
ncbi:MAG: bifunctional adenosylcobinamide kinase/adenosylcobinamide-phosphate guanylyltransferase [Eubacterium sp.]|nr:bifunctional adenosylcobinamide kinase/adenosylcobinamide-phosphate guanylyltransferase [Eubacterium sp.]